MMHQSLNFFPELSRKEYRKIVLSAVKFANKAQKALIKEKKTETIIRLLKETLERKGDKEQYIGSIKNIIKLYEN